MPLIQSFSVPRGNSATVVVDVTSDVMGETLVGATIYWRAWEQEHGVKTDGTDPVIQKISGGHGIDILDSPSMEFIIVLVRDDTLNLLGNFYHEAEVIDALGNHVTVMQGIMTVTEAEITQ